MDMRKTKGAGLVFAAAVAALCAVPVFGQTAEKLDAVLASERVSFGRAAGIILPAAGLLPPDATDGAAFAAAGEWLPRRADSNAPIRLGELSRLAMGAFGLSGGVLYRLFPGPRYAYRAMAWRRLLPPDADPGQTVSGEELLYITGRLLSLGGEDDLADLPVAVDAPAYPQAPQTPEAPETRPGQGLSSGSDDIMSYDGEFEVE
jgi:hypothetical protein